MPNGEKIVIVGFGWVGQANALALARMDYQVYYYDVVTPPFHYAKEYSDIYEQVKSLSSILEIDSPQTWYLVCIGDRVSPEGLQDISLIQKALESLRSVSSRVILRSTVLPNYLADLPFQYYLPEFLHELMAVEECLNPFLYVLGSRGENPEPSFLTAWQARSLKVFLGTPEEASHIKYLSNIWNATRIAFTNEFGNSIALPKTEAERLKNERILDFVLERKSYLRYGRAYSGHCLPKDMRAYNNLKSKDLPLHLLKGVEASNNWHAEIQQTYHTLPELFSAWDYASARLNAGVWASKNWQKLNQVVLVKRIRHLLQPVRRTAEKILPLSSLDQLKDNWDKWAKTSPFYFSNPDSPSGKLADEFETRKTGQADFESYILQDQVLKSLLGNFKEKSVLEIGCGVGRITESLAKNFKQVVALDISPNMLAIARKRLADSKNVTFEETAGTKIPLADNSEDFIFSYLVFKHLPLKAWIEDYCKEIARTLKPGGVAKIQFRTGPEVYRWRWFHGVSLTENQARTLAGSVGLTVVNCTLENSKSMWLTLKK